MRSFKLLHAIALSAVLLACMLPATAVAQPYPSKPIRFIVPSAAGAGNDTTTRAIAQKLTQAWGQQVIVDNRAGDDTYAPQMVQRLATDGSEPAQSVSPDKLKEALNREYVQLERQVKELGLKF